MDSVLESMVRAMVVFERITEAQPTSRDHLLRLAQQIERDTPGITLAEIEYGMYLARLAREEV